MFIPRLIHIRALQTQESCLACCNSTVSALVHSPADILIIANAMQEASVFFGGSITIAMEKSLDML